MKSPVLVIPAVADSPALSIHVNLFYNLYHYLAKRAPAEQRHPALAEAARTLAIARFPIGAHGAWDEWERPLAQGEDVETAIGGMAAAMHDTATHIGEALQQAESVYRELLWPRRLSVIEAAVTDLRDHLAPRFPAMVHAQCQALDLTFPPEIDAFLVAECYDGRGGYSDPLTLDVNRLGRLDLYETVLHEATHLAERHTRWTVQHTGLGDRLRVYLVEQGLTNDQAYDVGHAVLFAASAVQVRTFLEPRHVDYAHTHHDLYARFRVPDLPVWWDQFVSGRIDEPTLFASVAQQAARHVPNM